MAHFPEIDAWNLQILFTKLYIQGVSKKRNTNSTGVTHYMLNLTIWFLHGKKEELFSFPMILLLYPNNMKWPNTFQIKIAGRNHNFVPLGIEIHKFCPSKGLFRKLVLFWMFFVLWLVEPWFKHNL